MSKEKIYLILGFGVLCLSSSSILVKQLESRSVPLLGVACYRMVFAALLLGVPALIWQRKELVRLDRIQLLSIIASSIFLALHFGSWTVSLQYIPVARSVLLVTSHPIFTVLASRVFLGERFSSRTLAGVLFAFAGILVILYESIGAMQGPNLSLWGDILALTGAVTIVGYLIIGKRLRAEISLLSYTSTLYTSCALLLLPGALALGAWPQMLGSNDYLLLFALALVPTIGGHTVFNLLLKDVSATLISVAFLGEPLGASLLAWLLLDQLPTTYTIAGGVLVLMGIYLVQAQPNRPR
ncbi:MAG: DMT family transporter [Acidobacteriota bacterium]